MVRNPLPTSLAQHVPARVVMEILGHSQIALTMDLYGNPRELHQMGAFALVAWQAGFRSSRGRLAAGGV